MALTTAETKEIFLTYGIKNNINDSGSPESQVALFSKRITYLTAHLKMHPKDKSSRRGLISLVEERKKQLAYLQHTAIDRYRNIITTLGLRK